jgi:hypothetical protein
MMATAPRNNHRATERTIHLDCCGARVASFPNSVWEASNNVILRLRYASLRMTEKSVADALGEARATTSPTARRCNFIIADYADAFPIRVIRLIRGLKPSHFFYKLRTAL